MFSEIFFTTLYTSLIGCLIAITHQCYRSKCKEVQVGCIKVIRDVEGEEQLDRQSTNPIQSNSNL